MATAVTIRAGATMTKMLKRKRGCTIEQMAEATGWAQASVRAWLVRQRAAGQQIDALSPGRRGAPAAFRLAS